MRFIDTNVLLYRVSEDPAERHKAEVAANLLQATDLALSVQVLQEFYVQATRATRAKRLSHDEAQALIEAWLRLTVQEMTVDVLRAAIQSSTRFQLSYWDAAIIESARKLGCKEVLSEDLNAGQSYNGVRVVNPFQSRRSRSNGNR
ncbi:MAG: PIN domain-containing protein [Planctomycetaceae bacterium]|nr:PIN domain-containing protein [Planctomycetaceae bacterium]